MTNQANTDARTCTCVRCKTEHATLIWNQKAAVYVGRYKRVDAYVCDRCDKELGGR